MGNHLAIAATSNAIKLLLDNAAAASGEWSMAGVELAQAADLQKPVDEAKPTVTIYLYRVALSSARRDRGLRLGPDGQLYQPSIPLDLHYLVTAWSNNARTAHQLLGWTIRTLHDTPVLPTGLLNTYLPGEPVFATDETVELLWEAVSLGDLNDIWAVSQQVQSPSATYRARMVLLDSDVPLDEGDPVGVREFQYAKGPA